MLSSRTSCFLLRWLRVSTTLALEHHGYFDGTIGRRAKIQNRPPALTAPQRQDTMPQRSLAIAAMPMVAKVPSLRHSLQHRPRSLSSVVVVGRLLPERELMLLLLPQERPQRSLELLRVRAGRNSQSQREGSRACSAPRAVTSRHYYYHHYRYRRGGGAVRPKRGPPRRRPGPGLSPGIKGGGWMEVGTPSQMGHMLWKRRIKDHALVGGSLLLGTAKIFV